MVARRPDHLSGLPKNTTVNNFYSSLMAGAASTKHIRQYPESAGIVNNYRVRKFITITSGNHFVVPPSVTEITVKAWGGGGSGGFGQ